MNVAHWAETLAFVDERRRAVLDRDPTGRDGVDLLEIELVRACLTAALGDHRLRDEALASAGAAATAAAIAWVRDRGRVELPVPGGARLVPARGVSIGPSTWLAAVGACRVLRDEAGLTALGHPPLLELLGEIADDFWTPVGRALTGPTAESIATARAAVAEHGATAAEPEFVSLRVRPLLEILNAGDQAAFDAALAAAVRCHDEFYLYDEWEYDSLGLLALPVLGLAAHGHDRGFHIGHASDRLPPDLIRGGLRALGPVRYHFPPARLHRREEAQWFLDLEGFPRQGRGHDRREEAGRMMGTYTARNGPGILDAILVADEEFAPGLEDLLDVGELVLVADLLAGRGGDDRRRRAWLTEAADCLAAARDRSEPRFVHERGWAAYRAEPSRFDPDRLAAVESAWREMADSAADVSTTVLRLRLEPMLQAIASDRTGVALRELRPRDDDYAKTFAAAVVDRARRHYESLWAGPLDFRHPDSGAHVEIHVAPLGDDQELFPGGRGEIAGLLLPGRVWASWRYVTPGRTAGLSYDGLAWCDDHWAWFPKPYRLLPG
ncbi:immunity 49 family protein [Actinoplanes sp. KI2]|uniref:immunity 49 family protein n=1 Tax=Actinoplanes sp. KI2 TaxID=2983315 RepID=UPI0021D5FEB8|nr:immunity 49 family protein [Actinoplanes sp. KI2]MCU7727654.1 immunity 49 family protein [Actinoplanes sp. KI2]